MERFHSKKILKRIEIFLSQICFKCSIITPEEASEISFQIIGSAKKSEFKFFERYVLCISFLLT